MKFNLLVMPYSDSDSTNNTKSDIVYSGIFIIYYFKFKILNL